MITLLSTNRHSTATDKRHIEALLQSGKTQAKINRAIWVIEKGNPATKTYTISKHIKDRGWGWIGDELRQSKYTFEIKYTPKN